MLNRAAKRDLAAIAAALDAHGERPAERLRMESGDKDVAAVAAAVNRAFDAELARDRERAAAEERFNEGLAALAHDLRTPLAGAQGYLQLAERAGERGDNAEKARYLAAAGERLAAMRALTEDLFDFARVSASGFQATLELAPVELEAAVIKAFAARYPDFEARSWVPELDLAGDGARVLADPEALERIAGELAANALAHGSDAPRIHVAGPELVVANPVDPVTAAGIDLARVFDDFYQADSSRHGKGSGLGLATVRRLAAAMGATATAELLPGPVFSVTLRFLCS